MTTEYPTQESALFSGLGFAGRSDLFKNKSLADCFKNLEIRVGTDTICQLGYVHEDNISLTFENKNGVEVTIITTKFRNGFDLWLVDPETGYGSRT